MDKSKIAYVYPRGDHDNLYLERNTQVWKLCGFEVRTLPKKVRWELFTGRDERILILNWFEDRIGYSKFAILETMKCLLYIAFFKVYFKKIVWVRHNFKPHSMQKKWYFNLFLKILGKVSDIVVTHRHVDKIDSSVVPHPTYEFPEEYIKSESERDIEFLCFGKIKKYKNIANLLRQWPEERRLQIVGSCDTPEIKKEILGIIADRNLDVALEDRFVSYDELCQTIGKSKYVILPHQSETMIVSGALYHAVSGGANVVFTDREISEYFKNQLGNGVYDFEEVMNSSRLPYTDPRVVVSSAEQRFGLDECARKWNCVL